MKKLVILGSTGSIGTQTIEVVRMQKDIEIVGLSCGSKIQLLAQQIAEFHPRMVCVSTKELAEKLKEKIRGEKTEIVYGMEGLVKLASLECCDIVETAIVGMMGIQPTIAAIKAGKDIALANKETLVTAGHIIMPLAKSCGVSILPVDSEHSAIFQSLNGKGKNEIYRIILTASGGPFRGMNHQQMENVTLEDALNHPNWSMGNKITIDSATMVNKGLEVMEAMWLFQVPASKIQVVVHPQSILHSAVEYQDGAVIAQLGTPDMKLPIEYALCYPQRREACGERLNFYQMKDLTFEEPDLEAFKGLKLAFTAISRGGNVPTIYNAANECAVALFLNGKIQFIQIPEIIEQCMIHVNEIAFPTLEEILKTQNQVNTYVESRW